MIAWLRLSAVACSFTLAANAAHAEIKLLCTLAGEPPQLITVDEQAKTVDKFPSLTVFKVSNKAVWLIDNNPPDLNRPPDVKFTVIERSTREAGALKTIVINEDASVHDSAYPYGRCWEQK
jgi:hypothetical protein